MVKIKKSLVITGIIALVFAALGVALAFSFNYLQFDSLLDTIKSLFDIELIKFSLTNFDFAIMGILISLGMLAIVVLLFIVHVIVVIAKRRPGLLIFGIAGLVIQFIVSVTVFVSYNAFYIQLKLLGVGGFDIMQMSISACTVFSCLVSFVLLIVMYCISFSEKKHQNVEKANGFEAYNVTPEFTFQENETPEAEKIEPTVVHEEPIIAPVVETKQTVNVTPVAPSAKPAAKPVKEAPKSPKQNVTSTSEGTKRTLTKKEMLEQLKIEEEEKAKKDAQDKMIKEEAARVAREEIARLAKEAAEKKEKESATPVAEPIIPTSTEENDKENAEIVDPLKETEPAPVEKKIINVYHISQVKATGQWKIKLGNSSKVIKLFDTQAEAIEYAKGLSKNNDRGYLVHSKKGTIRKA